MRQGLLREYHVGDEIGRGRFGTVHHCTSAATGESYAVKSVDKSAISDAVDRDLVDKEAKFTQMVTGHPNVVGLHRIFEDDSSVHLVLDLCRGPDLHTRIVTDTLSESAAAGLMRPLMEAIAHCHSSGVAHRDVKPENVLFDGRDRLKLADFGSAGWFGDGRAMEGLVGTPYYVAPEVVEGREYSEKVDVWSAGVILYIMLGGSAPFYGETAVETFQAVLRANLRFPPALFRGVSSSAKELLRKMLAKDVNRRLSAEQVLREYSLTGLLAAAAILFIPLFFQRSS